MYDTLLLLGEQHDLIGADVAKGSLSKLISLHTITIIFLVMRTFRILPSS